MAKASIIIPVYNKEQYLRETLQSIDQQSEHDLEVVIIDDNSTDHSRNIICEFKASTKKQVEVIQNSQNMGVAYNRNLGVEVCSSDYLLFLDGDDILTKDFMKIMLEKSSKYPHADYTYSLHVPFKGSIHAREIHLMSNCFPNYEEDKLVNPGIDLDYIKRASVTCNGRLYQKNSIQNLKFVESHFEDYEFFLDTMAKPLSCIYTTQPVYGYRITKMGKYQTSIRDIKSSIDHFDIYERIEARYPNMDNQIHKWITKRHIYICVNYLKDILSKLDLESKDLVHFSRNYKRYLNVRYGYCDEKDSNFKKEMEELPENPEAIKENIRKIVMKY